MAGKGTRTMHTVAVGGVMSRIGATSQTLQIIRYLQLMGYRVCYVEMNEAGYPEKVFQLYRKAQRKKNGAIEFQGISLYDRESMKENLRKQYDFIVKDYGSVDMSGFEEVSFLEQDLRFLVCGVKPEEIRYTETALGKYGEECQGFLFNFVPVKDREEIYKMMREKAKITYFVDEVSDPFLYTPASASIYQAMLMIQGG